MNEIEKLKNSLSMTTKEFAEHFGIPYNTVRQWVKGERKCPEYVISMLQKLIEYKTQGKQISIFDNQQNVTKGYFVEIIHEKTNRTVYSRSVTYFEYAHFEENYWYVEYVKNKKGYKVNCYILNKIN